MHFAKALLPVLFLFTACHSPGPYGHAVNYAPLGDEEKAAKGARDYDPVMAQRRPEEWSKTPVSLFGIVTNRGAGPFGAAYLTMSVRRLEKRNLCENANDEDTCLVTVSDADFGVVHAQVVLKGEDDIGEHSVGGGSLVRLVGGFVENVDPNDGALVMKATFVRHWPRYTYTTKAAASQMRQ